MSSDSSSKQGRLRTAWYSSDDGSSVSSVIEIIRDPDCRESDKSEKADDVGSVSALAPLREDLSRFDRRHQWYPRSAQGSNPFNYTYPENSESGSGSCSSLECPSLEKDSPLELRGWDGEDDEQDGSSDEDHGVHYVQYTDTPSRSDEA